MIVVGASIVANAVADDGADGRRCRTLLAGGGRAAAPDVVDMQVLMILHSMWRAGHLDAKRLLAAVDDLAELPLTRWPSRHLTARALAHRARLDASEALYVALAEVMEAELVTADRRLATTRGVRCPVRVLD